MSKRPYYDFNGTDSNISDINSNSSSINYNTHFQELGRDLNTNGKFKQIRYQQAFVLQKLDSVEDPTKILRHCFQQCIDRTMANQELQIWKQIKSV